MFAVCMLCVCMYVCIFIRHVRIHMDIGNSKNYLGIRLYCIHISTKLSYAFFLDLFWYNGPVMVDWLSSVD